MFGLTAAEDLRRILFNILCRNNIRKDRIVRRIHRSKKGLIISMIAAIIIYYRIPGCGEKNREREREREKDAAYIRPVLDRGPNKKGSTLPWTVSTGSSQSLRCTSYTRSTGR